MVNIRNCIQSGRLTWFGHVERMDECSWVKKCREIVVREGEDIGELGEDIGGEINLGWCCMRSS